MMLSKSRDDEESSAAQKPKPLDAQKKAQEVADLERRLKDLTTSSSGTTATPAAVPSAVKPATAAATTTSNSGGAGGKNALLARIMAAQERAKYHQQATATHAPAAVESTTTAPPPAFATRPPTLEFASPPPPPPPPALFTASPPPDFFSAAPPPPPPPPPAMFMAPPPAMFAAPPTSTTMPPSFDFLDTVGGGSQPPVFDATFLPPPKQQAPPSSESGFLTAPEAPSAPSFDLLMMDPAPSPPAMAPPAMAPPQTATGLDDEAIQVILAMEGMSDADKQQLIQEQLNIMKSIENNKRKSSSNAQLSAADAFEQRSFSANVQAAGNNNMTTIHGPERTRRALADGSTVVTVQCAACDTLLQVTGAAQFMFCPTCQTVTPVVADNNHEYDSTTDDRAQLEADMRLAQELQKEEYESADRQEQRRTTAATAKPSPPATTSQTGTSWMEWLGLSSPAPVAAASSRSEEEISFEQQQQQSSSSLGVGQTAEKAPLFACVTDSISSAANYALSLPTDEEGNVHGVDSSSLLAVPQVGRNTNTKSPP